MPNINAKTVILLIANFVCICMLSFAQPVLKEPRKNKDFGKSLEQYGKKDEKDKKTKATDEEETIKVETNLVANDVLVINQKGNALVGLKKEDFIIKENGETQNIEVFSYGESADIPRSIVLVIDYSTSLLPYIENSVEAAKVLVDKLHPQDRMAIVTDDVKLLVDFTRDKKQLKKTLDDLKERCKSFVNGGKSWQYSALLAVLNEMFDNEDIRPIIIFQTDGDEYNFLKPIKYFTLDQKEKFPDWCKNRDKGYCERTYGFADIKEKIEKSRATIYSIIPGIRFVGFSEEEKLKRGEISNYNKYKTLMKGVNEEKLVNYSKTHAADEAVIKNAWQTSVVEVSNLSGGYADFLEKPEDAATIYSSIFQVIENRYLIGYYPKNEAKDGKRRNVKIEVKGHPEYIVVGRKSYIAPIEEK
jgi:VWFA-related protein